MLTDHEFRKTFVNLAKFIFVPLRYATSYADAVCLIVVEHDFDSHFRLGKYHRVCHAY